MEHHCDAQTRMKVRASVTQTGNSIDIYQTSGDGKYVFVIS